MHPQAHQDNNDDAKCPYQALLMLSRPGVDFTEGEFYVAEAKEGGVIRREVAFENRFDLVIFQVPCIDPCATVLCKVRRQHSTTQYNMIQKCNQWSTGQ
jgi:hypothetical protein